MTKLRWKGAILPVAVLWGLTLGSDMAFAQGLFGSNSPSNGPNGRTGSTGSAVGGSGMNAGGMSSGGLSGNGGGLGSQMQAGGLNSGGLGSTAGGSNSRLPGTNTNPGFVGMRQAGSGAGQTGRNGMNGMNGMNGRNAQGMNGMNGMGFGQNQFNQRNRNQQGGRNRVGQQGMGNQNFGGGNGGMNANQQRQIQPSLKVGFDYKPASVEASHVRLTAQVTRLSERKEFRGVEATSDGKTLTLRGEVKDAQTRKLLERMAKLDPAVNQVRNELTIAGEEAERDMSPR